jgi:hypothetical protein
MAKQRSSNPLERLLSDSRVRSTIQDGDIRFDAQSVLAALAAGKRPAADTYGEWLDVSGVLELILSADSTRARALKRWIIESARQRLDEAHNPELAFLRAQKLYRRRGYDKRWIDKRLRNVSTRQDLVSEWHRRGARDSEHYRELTNRLMTEAFGMDVETYRRYKGLSRATEKLRDYMTDLELALVSLAETAATTLSRDRNSATLEQLQKDVTDAGKIVARTRTEIERAGGKPVIESARAARPAQAA